MPSGGHSTTSIPRPRPAAPAPKGSGGRGGRRGSARATVRATKSGARGTAGRGGTSERGSAKRGASRSSRAADRRRDLTKAIPVERRLVEGRRKRWLLYGGGGVLFVAFAAALFVLPLQAWRRQQDDITRKQEELAALERANAELNEEVAMLNTPEGIEEAAREEIGYVRRGEIQLTVLPLPAAPTALPGGWPFDAASQILTLRGATATAIADDPAGGTAEAPTPDSAAP